MSSPCNNCGADFRVCTECDFHNGKYIEKSVIEDIRAEIEAQKGKWDDTSSDTCFDIVLQIIDRHMKG